MSFRIFTLITIILFFSSCNTKTAKETEQFISSASLTEPTLVILGTIQDAGSPHIACKKACCKSLFENPNPLRKVVSLGLIDPGNHKSYLFEATPDITSQLKKLKEFAMADKDLPDGIFLTHAHIGHYTGLMYLGKEATNASQVPVFAMPRMKNFLETNGPWSQLVSTNNISLQLIEKSEEIELGSNIKVTPFTVPHRDEFSETSRARLHRGVRPERRVVASPQPVNRRLRRPPGISLGVGGVFEVVAREGSLDVELALQLVLFDRYTAVPLELDCRHRALQSRGVFRQHSHPVFAPVHDHVDHGVDALRGFDDSPSRARRPDGEGEALGRRACPEPSCRGCRARARLRSPPGRPVSRSGRCTRALASDPPRNAAKGGRSPGPP